MLNWEKYAATMIFTTFFDWYTIDTIGLMYVWADSFFLRNSEYLLSFLLRLLTCVGNLDKAEMIAKEALKVLSSAPSVHFHLGNILGKLSRYREAENHFKQALDMEPNNANYWGNLGIWIYYYVS